MKIKMSCGHLEDWPDPNNPDKTSFLLRMQKHIEDGLEIPCFKCWDEIIEKEKRVNNEKIQIS